uniref:Uncharacterized protein n=1 Tax=Parascaris univalens TaxID=6257 RepID=A0A915CIP8_PARUN
EKNNEAYQPCFSSYAADADGGPQRGRSLIFTRKPSREEILGFGMGRISTWMGWVGWWILGWWILARHGMGRHVGPLISVWIELIQFHEECEIVELQFMPKIFIMNSPYIFHNGCA